MSWMQVEDQTQGTRIGDRIRVADTSLTRLVGLLSRSSLNAGEGLWIKPCSGVHTVGMRFAIDVIGLDKDHRVIKLWHNLPPFRVTSVSTRLRSVIELPAGRIQACGVAVGDSLTISASPVCELCTAQAATA